MILKLSDVASLLFINGPKTKLGLITTNSHLFCCDWIFHAFFSASVFEKEYGW